MSVQLQKKGKTMLGLICIVSMLALAACSSTGGKPQAEGETSKAPALSNNKTISIGITNAPTMFNPIENASYTEIFITAMMFLPFVDLDESLKFVPRLADSIDTKDNVTFIVKLNPKAKWTDGKPVTADDTLFTIQLMANPKVQSYLSSYFSLLKGFDDQGKLPEGVKDLEGVKKIDDHTIEFTAKRPIDLNVFNEKIAQNIKTMPKHVLQDVAPEQFQQNSFVQKPNVSFGAFKFVSYQRDQYVELEANKDYFQGAPKIDKLYFKIMPAANIVAQLQSGEIQMNYPGIGNIPAQDYEKVRNMSNVRTIPGKPLGYQFLSFNTKTIPDARVRQAIAHAINREVLVNNLLKGEGEIVDTSFTSVHPYLNKNIKPYDYNPKQAQQLLQEAGWDFNKTLTLVVPSGNKVREQSADIIVGNLKAIGVKAQINKFDFSTAWQKATKGEFDLCIFGEAIALDPDMSLSTYLKTGGTFNITGYSNAEMDALLQQGIMETDPDKRHVIYDKVQELWVKDMPMLTLYSEYYFKAVSKNVKVGEPKVLGMLNNVQDWDIEN